MNQKVDHICPLCGGRNECAMAGNGKPGQERWCRGVAMNPAAIALANSLQNNKSCLCKRCAIATNQDLEMQQVKARLYGTAHCHLCDEAQAMINKAGVDVVNVDIIENDNSVR